MKPITIIVVWSIACLAAEQLAFGQSPVAALEPAPLVHADTTIGSVSLLGSDWSWGPPPLPPIPDAFLWANYQRDAAGYDLSHPWQPRSYAKQPRSWPVMSFLSHCFHDLFSIFPGTRRHQGGTECGQPTLATMLGCQGGQVATDCGCFPQAPPEGSTAAPQSVPVPLPANEREIEVPELRPVPSPQLEERQPERTTPFLPPARSPVVELAPDPVLPPEPPSVSPPKNRIPTPGERLPKNVVPLPRNVVPPRR